MSGCACWSSFVFLYVNLMCWWSVAVVLISRIAGLHDFQCWRIDLSRIWHWSDFGMRSYWIYESAFNKVIYIKIIILIEFDLCINRCRLLLSGDVLFSYYLRFLSKSCLNFRNYILFSCLYLSFISNLSYIFYFFFRSGIGILIFKS